MVRGAIPSYTAATRAVQPIDLLRSNLLDSATVTWAMDGVGRLTPNVIGGASTNAQPPSENLTNWSTVATQALRVAKTVFVSTNGNDATGAREWSHLPFASIPMAASNAQPFDIIRVGPGVFYTTNTTYLSNGVALIGAGPNETVMHSEVSGSMIYLGHNGNYIGFLRMLTTNYVNSGPAVPLQALNATNLICESLQVDAYYDAFVLQGGGSAKFYDMEIDTAYDCFNITWGSESTVEFYGGHYRANYNKGGATKPPDSRVITTISGPKIKAFGSHFESVGWTNGKCLDLIASTNAYAVFAGCRIYSDGIAINNWRDVFDEGDPFTPIGVTHNGVIVLEGCEVVGDVRGPIWGSITGTNGVAMFGAGNAATNATNAFIAGYSNSVTALGAYVIGRGITNNTANTLQYGLSDATKSTITTTNHSHLLPQHVAATVHATNIVITNRVIHAVRALTYSGTNVTVDWSQGIHWYLLLTNTAKLWFTNAPGLNWGETGLIDFEQDGTGGHLLYWSNVNIQTNPQNAVVLSVAANARDDMHVKTFGLTGTNFNILLNTGWAK